MYKHYSLSNPEPVPALGRVTGLREALVATQAVGEVGVEVSGVRGGDGVQEQLQRTVGGRLLVPAGHAGDGDSGELHTGPRGGEGLVRDCGAGDQAGGAARLADLRDKTYVNTDAANLRNNHALQQIHPLTWWFFRFVNFQ